MNGERMKNLAEALDRAGLDAMALSAGPDLAYLTGLGFHAMERPTLLLATRRGELIFTLPRLEAGRLEGLGHPYRAYPYGEDPARWGESFAAALRALGGGHRRIGLSPRQLRLFEYRLLEGGAADSGTSVDFVDAAPIMESMRSRKDEGEVAALRAAVAIAEAALEAALPRLGSGLSEAQVAAELFASLLREGSEPSMTGSPLVLAGPSASDPHASPSERRLARGDILVIDFGAAAGGYLSDLTRSFSIGEPSGEAVEVHGIVLEANEAGRRAGGPGVPREAVDAAARAVIEAHGYGEYFTHRTGHGIGRECHEEPYIRAGEGTPLEAGMAYTVEPGIYLPGRLGLRIEDDLVVTQSGVECLSSLDRGLRILG